jgi:transposase
VASGQGDMLTISAAQAMRLYAIAKGAGWADDDLKAWLETEYGYHSSKEIPRRQYDEIVEAVKIAR